MVALCGIYLIYIFRFFRAHGKRIYSGIRLHISYCAHDCVQQRIVTAVFKSVISEYRRIIVKIFYTELVKLECVTCHALERIMLFHRVSAVCSEYSAFMLVHVQNGYNILFEFFVKYRHTASAGEIIRYCKLRLAAVVNAYVPFRTGNYNRLRHSHGLQYCPRNTEARRSNRKQAVYICSCACGNNGFSFQTCIYIIGFKAYFIMHISVAYDKQFKTRNFLFNIFKHIEKLHKRLTYVIIKSAHIHKAFRRRIHTEFAHHISVIVFG